jgi:hypothetical protein
MGTIPRPGDIITLAGLTNYGKSIIENLGADWNVLSIGPASPDSPFENGEAIAHIAPCLNRAEGWRIIRMKNDKNFEIIFTKQIP